MIQNDPKKKGLNILRILGKNEGRQESVNPYLEQTTNVLLLQSITNEDYSFDALHILS